MNPQFKKPLVDALVVIVIVSAFILHENEASKEGQLVPCLFIFGDSLSDNGNNNYILSIARAYYYPYGIDFPGGATGRFSNGKTQMDVVTELLGFKSEILPNIKASGREILKGVNYASAAGGIRETTGYHLGSRTSFSSQVDNYKSTVLKMVDLLGGEEATAKYLRKCIFNIGMGSNDYLNNYFKPHLYPASKSFSAEQFATDLIEQYSRMLTTLYNFGARKFVLHGLGKIGCVPSILAKHRPDNKKCVDKFNNENEIFSIKLRALVDSLNDKQNSAKYIYLNTSGISSTLDLKVSDRACCGVGTNNADLTCLPFQDPCPNRKEYLFWDAFHPTEAVNIIVGKRVFQAQEFTDTHPMDIRSLAKLVIN